MVKINNIKVGNVSFSNDEENIIFAKNFKEEFFGIYNVDFLNDNIVCESKIPNYVSCEVFYNGQIYDNVVFKIEKSNREKIVINEDLLDKNTNDTKFKPLNKIIDVEELIRENIEKENDLIQLKESVDREKKILLEGYNSLKTEYNELKKNKSIIKKELKSLENRKKQIIEEKDEFIIKNEIENIKKSIIDDIKKELLSCKGDLILETNQHDVSIAEDFGKINKKVEIFEAKLSSLDKTNTKTQNLIQTVKNYTDSKVSQALAESKRFTRAMMDMVGGGSGSVAVQYAKGGVINGDLKVIGKLEADVDVRNVTFENLDVTGDLDVGGTLSASTILSGGKQITDIFAGEGEGDTNTLDGGLV